LVCKFGRNKETFFSRGSRPLRFRLMKFTSNNFWLRRW